MVAMGVFVGTAKADVIGIDIASVHAHPGMNNVNPGLYLHRDDGWSGGFYYNSERHMTGWLGYTIKDEADRFAITLGAASGYKIAPIIPIVIPSVRIGLTDTTSVRLSLALAKSNPALHLSLETRFR
ncbi:MAG TPA: hypothetical protein VF443_04750 [Nitrospira sp.]